MLECLFGLTICSSLLAADVLVVDAASGPGTDFSDVQAPGDDKLTAVDVVSEILGEETKLERKRYLLELFPGDAELAARIEAAREGG